MAALQAAALEYGGGDCKGSTDREAALYIAWGGGAVGHERTAAAVALCASGAGVLGWRQLRAAMTTSRTRMEAAAVAASRWPRAVRRLGDERAA